MLSQVFQDTPAQALRAYLHLDLPDNAPRWTLSTYRALAKGIFMRRHLVLIKVRAQHSKGRCPWNGRGIPRGVLATIPAFCRPHGGVVLI